MSKVWVYKADGSRQCDNTPGVSPEKMREELAHIVPDESIIRFEKRTLPLLIPALCGTPTGHVNAYELTPEGFYVLMHGIVGPMGFALWIWRTPHAAGSQVEPHLAARGDGEPFPVALLRNSSAEQSSGVFANLIAALTESGSQPTLIAELKGRLCRCYKQGDMITLDYIPERVNIELTEHHRIARVWFG